MGLLHEVGYDLGGKIFPSVCIHTCTLHIWRYRRENIVVTEEKRKAERDSQGVWLRQQAHLKLWLVFSLWDSSLQALILDPRVNHATKNLPSSSPSPHSSPPPPPTPPPSLMCRDQRTDTDNHFHVYWLCNISCSCSAPKPIYKWCEVKVWHLGNPPPPSSPPPPPMIRGHVSGPQCHGYQCPPARWTCVAVTLGHLLNIMCWSCTETGGFLGPLQQAVCVVGGCHRHSLAWISKVTHTSTHTHTHEEISHARTHARTDIHMHALPGMHLHAYNPLTY